ncbi:MAG TPA: flagellin [Cellvibrionaceae bacterium]
MPLFINTNVSSINAQRQMVKAGAEMDKAMSRLSSGMRINSAKDDAAGLAISNRQTSQIRGLDQAVRNANDGVSLIQTAEGALGESTNILQRMRELAVQSSNGIYSDADRSTLDAEVKQLTKELDRIAKATSFNGQNILDGSVKKVELQVGTQAGQTIEMKLQSVDAKTLGMGSLTSDLMGDQVTATFDSQISLTNGDLVINGQSVIKDIDFVGSTDTVESLLNKINTNVNGVTASMVVELNASNVGTGVADSAGTTITLTKLNGATSVFNVADTKNLQEFADKVNSVSGGAVSATIDDSGKLHLMAKDAQTLSVGAAGNTGIGDTSDRGRITLTSDNGDPITIERGATGTLDKLDRLGFREIREAGTLVGAGIENNSNGAHEALDVGELTINGVVIDNTDTDTLQGKINNINKVSDETGVTAKAASNVTIDFTGYLASMAATSDQLSLNGVVYDLNLSISATNTDIAAAINTFKEESGVSARVTGRNIVLESDRGAITINAVTSGAGISLIGSTNGLQNIQQSIVDSGGTFVTSTTTIASGGTTTYQARAALKLESVNGNPISIELSDDSDAARLGLKETNNLTGGSFGSSISSISIDTADNASKALKVIDNALNTVNDIRSQLGAVNNRLDFTVSNLMNVSENTSAARSRITDADFAAESANLSRSQVLAQASQAMLAQANAKPQQVLSLLR